MNRNFALACAAAIALIVAAYANSLHNSFHFDDSHVIENNLYLRSLANVPRYFTDAHTFSALPQNATYRPLVTLSLALDYARAHGLDPKPFHVTQIALLLLTGALLVVFFTPIVGAWPSLFAATLFCVHTANTETMNLISARSELLSTVGLLASFVLYQRSAFARRTLLYLVPLVVGALAKAPLVVFAPLLFAYALLLERHSAKRALRIALPALVLGIVLLVALNAMNAPEWKSGGGARLPYLWTQPFAWFHYARLFVLPLGLTADTDWQPFAHPYDTRAVAGYAFAGALVFAIRAMVRRGRVAGGEWRVGDVAGRPLATRPSPLAIAFGLLWFAIALLPTSIFPLAEVVNEHRLFFAYIGLVLALATLVRTRALAIAAIVLLALHAIGTYARNQVWRTEETLWADVVAKSPDNGRAWMNYGLTRMAKGDYAAAKACFERAATLTPDYSVLEINRAIVQGALGDDAAAEAHFRRALQLVPDANAHFFYARWLAQHGRTAEALPHAREAVRQSPAFADAVDLLARLSHPSPYDTALRAGLDAIERHDWPAAVAANREALRHDASSADAWNNLGWSLAQLGQRDEAADAYRHALALRPNDERAKNNLRLVEASR